MLPAPLRGIVTPLVTPLAGPDELDIGGLERLIEHVIAGGITGIFILGTTGEGPSLSYRLREQMIRRSCALVQGRLPVLVSVSDTAMAETERAACLAADAGAAAAVLAPPYYFQYSQTDLLRYVERLAGRLPLPLFLYNIPQLAKVAFEPETVAQASQMDRVLGIKDSSGDLTYLARIVEALRHRPSFSILNGPEEILADALGAGCHGGVCGGSNLRPALFMQLFGAAAVSDGANLQSQVLRMSKALYTTGFPGSSYLRGLKSALEIAGICRGDLAPPLTRFSAAEYAQLAEAYRSLAPT